MRTWIGIAAVLLVVVLLVTGAAPAGASEGGEKRGLELEKQISWASVLTSIGVFLVLLFVLSKTAWKPILNGLQKREETIKQALDDAQAANERAKALIAEYEAKIDHAREEAQEIFAEARKDGDDIRRQIEEAARKSADETVARTQREIEQLTAKAWDHLVRDAAGIATEAASRIIGKELTPEGHAALVSSVVTDYAAKTGRSTMPPGDSDADAGEGEQD